MPRDTRDRPLSYWRAVARMGFENDLARLFDESGLTQDELAELVGTSQPYVSKILGGTSRANFTLETMAKFARAVEAIVQVRLVKEGREVVRVVDHETAAMLDGVFAGQMPATKGNRVQVADFDCGVDNLRYFPSPEANLRVTGVRSARVANG